MLVNVAWVALGTAIVLLAQFDVLVTVLYPEAESPLSNRFHRLIWRLFLLLDRFAPGPARRHLILNRSLPAMIAGLIALWLLLPLVGFACIYFPWIGDPAHFTTPDGAGRSPVEALYFSGVTLFTIGYGEFQPLAWPFRALAVAQAATGVITTALSVAYLLAVYPALSRRRSLAVALDAEVAGQADALPMVRRYLVEDEHGRAELTSRLRELGLELLALTEAHETHPVLYYAHPRLAQHSVLRILITVQRLVGLLRYGLSPDRHGQIVRNAQLLLLEQALHYSLRRLSASLHIPAVERIEDDARRRQLGEEYDRLCRDIEALGLVSARQLATVPVPVLVDSAAVGVADEGADGPTAEGSTPRADGWGPQADDTVTYTGDPDVLDPALDLSSDSPVEAYTTFRLESDPHIAAYAAACGYTIEEAQYDNESTWWVGRR